jgi:hypothetical protein
MVPVELGRKVVSGTVRHVELSSCRAVGTVRVLSGSCQVLLSSCRTGAQIRGPLEAHGTDGCMADGSTDVLCTHSDDLEAMMSRVAHVSGVGWAVDDRRASADTVCEHGCTE